MKKIICIIMVILSCVCYEDVTALVTYNANEWDTFKNRTKEEIGAKYGDAINNNGTYRDNVSSSYYEIAPIFANPYNGGKLSSDTHAAMVGMTNYYRWLIGVNPLNKESIHNEAMQVGALVRNYQFAHSIGISNKPADMSDEFWNLGASVSHNILARYSTPRGAINAWINEGYNLNTNEFGAIGHRTALIAANRSSVQFGYAGNIAIGKIDGYSNSYVNPFVAFPSAGYMPTVDVDAPYSAWHVELDTSKITIPSLNNVTVTVTNLNTNESYDCTKENGKIGDLSGASLIIFVQPANSDLNAAHYDDGARFKVEVTGLRDKATGDDAKIIYTTEFFDVKDFSDTVALKVTAPGGWTNLQMDQDVLDSHEEYLDLIAKALPHTLDIQTETGREATADVNGDWVVDRIEKVFKNTIDKNSVPSYIIDRDNILNEVKLSYEGINYTGDFGISPSSVNFGNEATLRIWRSASWLNQIEVFQVKDGNVTKRFDNNSPNFILKNQEMAGWDTVTFDATYADAGSYFAIAHENNNRGSNAYLLTKSNGSMSSLVVNDKTVSSFRVELPKNVYKIGDELDTTGGKIYITYEDGTTNTKDLTNEWVSGFNSSTSGEKTINVTYNGKRESAKILVIYGSQLLTTTYGRTLGDIYMSSYSYGSYTFVDSLSTSVGNAGDNKFKGKFIPTNKEFAETDVLYTVRVSKATPEYSKSLRPEATYGDTLGDIELPSDDIGRYEFMDDASTSVGNYGYHSEFKVRYVPYDTHNYNTIENIGTLIYVYKAVPKYTVPKGLMIVEGSYLDDITLPDGWSWDRPYTYLGEKGLKTFKATFTPSDNNYKVVEGIDVQVRVRGVNEKYLDGDVTRDGNVDLLDVMYALRISLNLVGDVDSEVLSIGDINASGSIDLTDVMHILRVALDLVN